MIGLIVSIITVIGKVIAAFLATVTAAILGLFATISDVLSVISRTIVKIVSLPFKSWVRSREPLSPLGIIHNRFH
jgi:hypothetical protein